MFCHFNKTALFPSKMQICKAVIYVRYQNHDFQFHIAIKNQPFHLFLTAISKISYPFIGKICDLTLNNPSLRFKRIFLLFSSLHCCLLVVGWLKRLSFLFSFVVYWMHVLVLPCLIRQAFGYVEHHNRDINKNNEKVKTKC